MIHIPKWRAFGDRILRASGVAAAGGGRLVRRGRARPLLHAGLILLMLGLSAFSIYQVARHLTVGLGTLRTQEIVDESYVELDLYTFRDEGVLLAAGSGVTHYAVRDGEKVGVGAQLGTAYAIGEMTEAEAEALQARLNAYGDRIALLQTMGIGTPADARAEAEAVDRYYMGLLNAAEEGQLSAVGGFADEMLAGIGRYDILTGNTAASGTVATLTAEQAALLSTLTPVATFKTDRSGYFYYRADGYEATFPYASAMTMTPAEFRTMTTMSPAPIPAGVVGKMVYSTIWYAAAYVDISDPAVELFQQGIGRGTTYRMTCKDSAGTVVNMTLERLVPDDEGVLLVFSSQDMPDGFAFSRTFRVETVALSVSGYRIPKEALVTLRSDKTGKDVTGVYILAGNVVEFRKVRVRVERDGYIIADTYEDIRALQDTYTEEQLEADIADGWSYLRLNDNIITSGNELYEGKMIS